MDTDLSSKFSSTLSPVSKVIGTTSTTQRVASFTRNKRADAERKFELNKKIGLDAVLMTGRSTLSCLSFSLQKLMENHDRLDSLPLFVRPATFLARPTLC